VCNEEVSPAVCSTNTVTITILADNDGDGDPDVTDPDDDNDGNPDTTDPNPFTVVTAPDALTVLQGQSETIDILANDDFLPGTDTSIVDAGTGTAQGIVVFDPLTGEMTYTPADGEEGTTVTVDYTVCNEAVNPAVCSTNTITITVLADNDGDGDPDITDPDDDNDGNPDTTDPNPLDPTTAPDAITIAEGDSGTLDILANDDFLPGANTIITNAGTGTAQGIASFDPLTGELTYTPAAGEGGTVVTLDYTVCNTAVSPLVCSTNTVTITVLADTDGDGDPDVTDPDDDDDGNPDTTDPNPQEVITNPDEFSITFGATGSFNILANDDFLPGANTSIVDAGTGTAQGTISFDPLTGEITYTPAPGEEGTAVTVDYTVCNEAVNPAICSTNTVTINVLIDSDGDGVPDVIDIDDDNDGIPDVIENGGDFTLDTDGDGIPDHLDLDSDGDGLTDLFESDSGAPDADGDGVIDGADTGSGANGLFDGVETFPDSGILIKDPVDTDGDGKRDFQDIDDDGDGLNTADEDNDGDGDPTNDDTDGDGIPDYLDEDDDGDGILTIDEFMLDCDEDGIPDHLDVTNCDLIPEGFSPDGDGINDTFVIPALANYPNFAIEIYNRYGNQVYDYKNNGRANPIWWDGFSTGRLTLNKSEPVPVGTYYYIIYFNKDGRKPITGWIYLNR
jgi:gliding motility-associated-like protein